jgi:hypothetical protein
VDVSQYRHPVLVRQRVTPMGPDQRRNFTRAANQAATLAMSAPERALSRGSGSAPSASRPACARESAQEAGKVMPKKGLKLVSPPAAVLILVALLLTLFRVSALATRFAASAGARHRKFGNSDF